MSPAREDPAGDGRDDQGVSQDDRYWAALGKTAAASVGWGLLTVVALLLWKPLAVLPCAITVGVIFRGTLRVGRIYDEDRNKRLAGRPKAVGWREEWRQDLAEVASDPSVELWRKHPGVAVACTIFAIAGSVGIVYLRLHGRH